MNAWEAEQRITKLEQTIALLLERWPIPPERCICDACSEAVYYHNRKV